VADERCRADAIVVNVMMQAATGERPVLWGNLGHGDHTRFHCFRVWSRALRPGGWRSPACQRLIGSRRRTADHTKARASTSPSSRPTGARPAAAMFQEAGHVGDDVG
jgi:hypothetical protein